MADLITTMPRYWNATDISVEHASEPMVAMAMLWCQLRAESWERGVSRPHVVVVDCGAGGGSTMASRWTAWRDTSTQTPHALIHRLPLGLTMYRSTASSPGHNGDSTAIMQKLTRRDFNSASSHTPPHPHPHPDPDDSTDVHNTLHRGGQYSELLPSFGI